MVAINEFKSQLPFVDKALTILAVFICLLGLFNIAIFQVSTLSIIALIASFITGLSIYCFKVLIIGLSKMILDSSNRGDSTSIKPQLVLRQNRGIHFGLCTFCNQFETKNTLSGRYVCSDCYQVFLKVKGNTLLSNLNDRPAFKKAS